MLTSEQQAAVESPHQNTSVVAGAGAGKTRAIAARVRWMLDQGYDPESIIVFTFTRKAANEIRERIGDCDGVRIGTFHSVCLDLLSEHRKLVPIDEQMADNIVKQISKTQKKAVRRTMIDACRVARLFGKPSGNADINRATDIYEGKLRHENAIDYLGMLLQGIELARSLPSHHVLVDEAQDTDDVQWMLVDALKKTGTEWISGDTRQSIYSFRGANPEAFDSRPGQRFYLTKTFRFGIDIAEFTNELAKRSGYTGEPITAASEDDTPAVAFLEDTVSAIEDIIEGGVSPSDIAVLCRYNSQVEQLTNELDKVGVAVAKRSSVDHSTMLAVMRYLACPWSPVAHLAFLNDKRACKLLPTLASDSLSTESCALIAESWLSSLSERPTPAEVIDQLTRIEAIGESMDYWKDKYSSMSLHEALRDFVNLDKEVQDSSGVNVMTVHASKGLEWQVVFVPLAPARRFDAEEWRCAYVATTRAQDSLILSGYDNPVLDVALPWTRRLVGGTK